MSVSAKAGPRNQIKRRQLNELAAFCFVVVLSMIARSYHIATNRNPIWGGQKRLPATCPLPLLNKVDLRVSPGRGTGAVK